MLPLQCPSDTSNRIPATVARGDPDGGSCCLIMALCGVSGNYFLVLVGSLVNMPNSQFWPDIHFEP